MSEEGTFASRNRWVTPVLYLVVLGILLFIFGSTFLSDPSRTAATRDPAWYTWRAGIITHYGDPGIVAGEWGPFSMFGGGYRVAIPTLGALLQSVAGTAQSSFPAFIMVGVPILAGLAFGAGAFRSTKSNLLYLLMMVITGLFFLTVPYVGYLDNTFVLYVLAALIGFLEPARHSWGARSAVFMLALLAAYTHPTTCVVFLGTMFAVLGFHMLTMRFNFRALLDRDLPALVSVVGGMVFGLLLWPLGKFLLWGTAGSLADAALPPPYTRDFFLDRLMEWVWAQYPLIIGVLAVLAIVWIWQRTRAEAKPADAYRTMIAWWMLPYAATLVFALSSKPLPYYRFMNSTAALMPLTAIGIWVVGMWLYRKTNKNILVAGVSFVVLAAGLSYGFTNGIEGSRWNDPTNQWLDQDTRVAMASVAAVVKEDPNEHPIVFINNYTKEFKAYGWSKTDANVGRAALPGIVVPRTAQYFGDLPNFLAGERTISNPECDDILEKQDVELAAIAGGKKKDANGDVVEDANGDPVKLPPRPECAYDLVSRGFLDQMNETLAAHEGAPYVFMIGKFNTPSDNKQYFDQAADIEAGSELSADGTSLLKLGPNVLLVNGEGYATPDDAVVQDAIEAGVAEQAYMKNHPGPLADPMHILTVLLGLIALAVIPGLIAAPWFQIEGWRMKLGLVPAVSLGMNIVVAIAVISVTRSAFTPTNAWISVGITTLVAVGLNLLARKRGAEGEGALQSLSGSVNRVMTKMGDTIDLMSVPFVRMPNFRALMLTQYMSMAADGVVAGTILTTVLNPDNAKTGKDLLAIVFLTYLPFALVAPFVGVLADRFDRRKLLIGVNNLRAILMVAAVVTLVAGVDAIALLSALALLVLAGFRLTLLVKGAGLPDAVEGQDLLLANSLSQAGGTIFQAGGAVAAVVVVQLFGINEGLVAVLAVALYLVAAYFARKMTLIETQEVEGTLGAAMRGVVRSVSEGVKEIKLRPGAAVGILSFWFTRTLVFGFIGLSLSFATFETLTGSSTKAGGQTEAIISVLFAGLGAGIGLFLAQYLKDKVAPARVIVTNIFLAGGTALLVPFTSVGRYVATFFAGLGFFMVKVAADTITQQSLPDDFRGRAYALFDISYALSYAIPAAVLYVATSANVELDWIVAGYGALLVLIGFGIGGWAKKLGLYQHVSDDLVGQELETGIPDPAHEGFTE